MGLGARVFGIITSPRDTYQAVVAIPEWFGMLAVATVAAAVLVGGFMLTPVGQDAWLAQMEASVKGDNAAQQMQMFEKMAPFAGYFTAATMLVFIPLLYVVCAGVLFAIFNAALGGDASFKQLFTVVTHTAPIGMLGQLFTIPMNYARGTMTSATNLSVFLPMLDEQSFAAAFASAIDLFLIWQVFVLAIGLAVLYRRRTQPIATSLFVLYAAIALFIAVVKSGS
jgi:hypothetical protein